MRTASLTALALILAACGQPAASHDAGPPDADWTAVDAYSPCPITCSSVQACCQVRGDYVCVDIYTNAANCGGCGIECGTGEVCIGGSCGELPAMPDAGWPDAYVPR